VPTNGAYLNVVTVIPTQDAVQEFKVQTNNLGPEYGRFAGGVINMTTKSGGNQYHGSFYEFIRNKVLNANDYFDNRNGVVRPPFTQNQFGVNGGGPILRDKLFFFVNYDGIREIHPYPVTTDFPTQAMRQGNFSNLCDKWSAAGLCTDTANGQQLYNPLTGQPYPNNQIPQTMIAPQAKRLSTYLPLPNVNFAPTPASGGGEFLQRSPYALYDWAGDIPLRFGTNNEQARLDGQLGTKDSVVGFATISKGAPWFYGYACCANFGS
jgi:hypothetical protein